MGMTSRAYNSQQITAGFTVDNRPRPSMTARRQWWCCDLLEATMQKHEPKITIKIRPIPANVEDGGKVRLGGESPSFGPVRAAPASTADNGKVRLGGESPSFGPIRAV